MAKKKHTKKKRQQPVLKKKKVKLHLVKANAKTLEEQLRAFCEQLTEQLQDRDAIEEAIAAHVSRVEGYFRHYDTVQLLGCVGLYLIDNLQTMEKVFLANYYRKLLKLDEDAEVMAEYALNFGLSMPNNSCETPTEEVTRELLESLKALTHLYRLREMPLDNDAEKMVDSIIHSETIGVRGDGYQRHLLEVFNEMFRPHTSFYEAKYGFSIDQMVAFFQELEDRIICKIGSQEMVYGSYKMWQRWKIWEQKTYGTAEDEDAISNRDFSKGLFGAFFEANPDVPHDEDGEHFVLFQPDDYTGSDRIFWVWPQSDAEKNIMEALSVAFGDNASFIAEGDYKGNIMNGHSIYEKPFVKIGERFYCFTPMIVHRNMFLIAEKLMKRAPAYYNQNFKQNTSAISRDKYVENKVRKVFESFLPDVHFYHSVKYTITDGGVEKKPELDILGVSEKAVFVIEVKAHELTHRDRVGLKGAKDKFKSSVAEACGQCQRTANYIAGSDRPVFTKSDAAVAIDKALPVYKIAVTFQHYSTLVGMMDELIGAGLMEEDYRDTWIVSLFDLMVCADFFESEDEFIEYLNLHKRIYASHSTFMDELDVLGGFLNDNLADKITVDNKTVIIGGSSDIDEEYSKDFQLPLENYEKK